MFFVKVTILKKTQASDGLVGTSVLTTGVKQDKSHRDHNHIMHKEGESIAREHHNFEAGRLVWQQDSEPDNCGTANVQHMIEMYARDGFDLGPDLLLCDISNHNLYRT